VLTGHQGIPGAAHQWVPWGDYPGSGAMLFALHPISRKGEDAMVAEAAARVNSLPVLGINAAYPSHSLRADGGHMHRPVALTAKHRRTP
jgi:hypothetical protein